MHLLEPPYKTNCMDYEDLWKKNNKTGPRSQEMCKEWCKWNIYKACDDCARKPTMLQKPKKMCVTNPCNNSPSEQEIVDTCKRSCKVNCKKLIYHYEILDELKDSLSVKSPESYNR
ncbi:uncharacterized protein NPIL_364661 [Nephila pilipes]|uniref:Uncharacterized protein n=1 Tax=Nephila pilipes TaxID=299642 RepID=A0A8X6PI26_NEPPI|nr:uncharacterized protein NPIL_364661 [Nephila pilipes]